MINTYIKPETVIVKLEQQQHILAGSPTLDMENTSINPGESEARGFGFDFFEEEEAPGKSDDEDWEDWEDEDDP